MDVAILERIESILLQRFLPATLTKSIEKASCLRENLQVNESSLEGRTLLHFASDYGLEKLSCTLITLGADVNIADNYGMTPLMLACYRGHTKIVNNLLAAGADPTILNHYGIGLLPLTLINQNPEIFFKIQAITKNIMCNSIVGQISVAHLAAALGTSDHLKILCSQYPDILNSQVEKTGMTCLMLAVNAGMERTVETLLELGASTAAINSYSMTALQIAASISADHLNLKLRRRLNPSMQLDSSYAEKSESDFVVSTPQQQHFLNIPYSESIYNFKHPLTPNICVSPKSRREKNRNVKGFFQLATFKRRSKSAESRLTLVKSNNDTDERDILEYILISTELYQYWPIFKSNEINFKTFITMNDEDLKSVGITKSSVRSKMIKVIKHNKRVFC